MTPTEILQEMIDAVNDIQDLSGTSYGEDVKSVLKKALDRISNDSGWISVKERMPKEGAKVCVYSPNRIEEDLSMFPYSVGVYFSQGGWLDIPLKGGFYIDLEPTHWMPLPLPPSK